MYGKLFESTFTGSMYGAGPVVFAVWSYIIAHTNSDSRVELNPAALAHTLGVKDVKEVHSALAKLASPDPDSRSKTSEGRRIVKEGEYQYLVVNHGIYRAIKTAEQRKEYNRLKKRESRKNAKAAAVAKEMSNSSVNECQTKSANVSRSVSVSVSEKEGGAVGNQTHTEAAWDPVDRLPPAPPVTLQDRCKRWLVERITLEADLGEIQTWPEIASMLELIREVTNNDRDRCRNSGDVRAKLIAERIAEGFTPRQIVCAFEAVMADEWYAADVKRRTITSVLKSAAQLDKFLAASEAPAVPQFNGRPYVVDPNADRYHD
jgi:hypothetical protein